LGLADLYGGGIYLYPDLLATQSVINWQGTFQTLTQLTNQAVTVNNSAVNSVWQDAYQVINQANNVLANSEKVLPVNKDRTEGEAKFLRGMVLFDLVRLYGRAWNDGDPATNLGVPIILTPTTTITEDSFVSRSTVAEVYAQAIKDLTEAESQLPADNGVYANTYAASAILARLYLQKGDYTNAVNEADIVISSGAFSLNANYADEFPYPSAQHIDNTVEDIFAVQVTAQQGTNYLNNFYASSDNSGRGDIIIRQSFVDGYEEGDTRAALFGEDSGGTLVTNKFDNTYGNIRVVRLAEMYLIRAEANLRIAAGSAIGDTPLNDINIIRSRAGLAELTTVSTANVLTERIHELAFEGGFFLHDAKRLQQNIGSTVYSSPRLVLPIPQQEIIANSNLVQNPGY